MQIQYKTAMNHLVTLVALATYCGLKCEGQHISHQAINKGDWVRLCITYG